MSWLYRGYILRAIRGFGNCMWTGKPGKVHDAHKCNSGGEAGYCRKADGEGKHLIFSGTLACTQERLHGVRFRPAQDLRQAI